VTEDDGAEGLPRTDGVVLVDALRTEDAEAHWAGEDEEHARRFGWYPRRSSLERVRAFLLETEQQWRDGGPRRTFAIRDAATHTLLGGCEARLQGDATAHLSWWMFPPWRPRGLATRGVRLMLGYAVDVLGVRHFVAYIEPDNLGSRGVARRLGFAEQGLDTTGRRPMLRYELTCAHAERSPS
jgi:RimJ/RimL family protein N-acetyltransferase